jgi:asparagine synthase (glutamine-hydrolysing)
VCGIAGYAGTNRPEILGPMCDAMVHRGPDGQGQWHDQDAGIGLGHRRLSIIDLSTAGAQPMSTSDGECWITYNGELYNFPEHRDRLARNGYPFKSRTDTEVLLALYQERGIDFLDDLNGMFALALWDGHRKQLLLARDHAGIKPLYYWQNGNQLYFASEIRSLLTIPEIPREVHEESLYHYLHFLRVPGRHTLLSSVKKVEPGHFLLWKDGEITSKRWFHLEYEPDDEPSEAQWVDEVEHLFLETTRRQMISDVPVGAFLSGGVDSSSIVASMRMLHPSSELKCYTIAFDEEEKKSDLGESDHPYARAVADHLGVELHSRRVESDVIRLLPKIIWQLDEPDADPAAILSYLIASDARDDGVKVLLSGTGGDEVFFGYRSHLAYRLYEHTKFLRRSPFRQIMAGVNSAAASVLGAQHSIPRRLKKFRNGLLADGIDRHLALADWSSTSTRERLLTEEHFSRAEPGGASCLNGFARDFRGSGEINFHTNLLVQTFLADHNFLYTDKTSMANSIETRVPFVDVELMRRCAQIPEHLQLKGMRTKHILKEAFAPHLPNGVVDRSKTGFGTPLRSWVQEDLQNVIRDSLGRDRVKARGFFEPAAVDQILRENQSDQTDHTYLIFALLNLEIWMQTFIDAPGVEVSLEL